jgi:hypothetical protein
MLTSPLFSTGMYGAGMGTSMYGMGGSMYGAGMMGSPYYGGGMMGPMTSLNQFLFSVQSVIFSLGQAVQVRHNGVFDCAHNVGLISCALFSLNRLWE